MSAILTNDLRSDAKDTRRVKEHKSKWARGKRSASGCQRNHDQWPFPGCDEACKQRPSRRGVPNLWARSVEGKRNMARENNLSKRVMRGDVVQAFDDRYEGLSDSSGDYEINDTSAAPELKEVMYSFDAPTGPTRGNHVLSFAITQAVQRYENNETDKIVKKEYDLVLDGKDEPESYAADGDDDDDFELIDGSHFK